MTATLGARLSILLSELGIAHSDDPDPVPRVVPAPDASATRPSSTIAVMVEVAGADLDAVRAAGLLTRSAGRSIIIAGEVRAVDVPQLAEVPGVVAIEIEDEGQPDIHSSVPATHADRVRTGTLGLTGAGVIVGVLDSGIDIFHHAFRNADGSTRLLSLLDLTAPYTLESGATTPTGGTFQLEWTPPESDEQQTSAIPFNADAGQVRTALETMAEIEPGDVAVVGGPLPGTPIVVSFQGRYLHKDVNRLRVSNSLTPSGATIRVERGHEYSRSDIDAALGSPPSVFQSWDERGHGTHVMGIAAGDGSQSGNCHLSGYYIGVAPKADLVAVKMRYTDTQMERGVNHVFDVADEQAAALGHPVPAVVNLSFSFNRGARDGSAPSEKFIDSLLGSDPAGRVIVTSAGNNGRTHDHTDSNAVFRTGSATHSRKTVAANGTTTMTAIVISEDEREDEFDFWYTGAGRLDVTVKAPRSTSTVGPVAPGDPILSDTLHDHAVRVRNRLDASDPGTHNIHVKIEPPNGGQVRTGEWVFTLEETAGTDVDLHCWIEKQRTDAHPRFSNADQDREFTLGPPGTARRIITVANYDHRDDTIYESSSRGPSTDTRTGLETKPDVAAPGVGITAAKSGATDDGICCDCCYDFYTSKSGTSMSAPHITGISALLLQRNHTLTWEEIRDRLRTDADPPDGTTSATLPDNEFGAGIVNAEVSATNVPSVSAFADSPVIARTGGAVGLQPELAGSASTSAARRRRSTRDLADVRGALLQTSAGQLLFSLFSQHLSEAMHLVNTNRRVTVAWHRMGGPELLRLATELPDDEPLRIPEQVAGYDVTFGFERLLDELARVGSLRLRTDIERHCLLLLTLPGTDLAALESIDVAG